MGDEGAVPVQGDQGGRLWRGLVFAMILLVEAALVALPFRDAAAHLVGAVVVLAGMLVFSPRLFDVSGVDIAVRRQGHTPRPRGARRDAGPDIGRLFAMVMGGPMYRR
jgi:hypothetical protein